jgi:uncharacterized protein YdeI (YjbR/CyaY-like superfamily)
VEQLTAEGKMTAAGLAAFKTAHQRQTPSLPAQIPKELGARFRGESVAWQNFQSFPAYYRRMTIGWVASAKKEETRLKRLQKLIDFSGRNEKIKFM